MKNIESFSKSIYYQMADRFEISAIYSHRGRLLFKAKPLTDPESAIFTINQRLKKIGFDVNHKTEGDSLIIEVSKSTAYTVPRLNVILFLSTLITMFFSEAISSGIIFSPSLLYDYLNYPGIIQARFEFTLALIAILLFHEFGHYLTGRRRGVLMSLPYFLPAPNIAGTFGAIIKSRSPITNRRDLIEVGAAGPIAGFIISVIALSIGLQNTEIVLTDQTSGLVLGDSLLLKFLSWLIVGPIPEGYDYALSPAAFAGWVGLLVTMINLLPLGQLDGGHIIYGMFGKAQHWISKLFAIGMVALGFAWPGWWFFGALVLFFGIKHPPTLNDSAEISKSAYLLGLIAIIIFVISFIPVPFDLG